MNKRMQKNNITGYKGVSRHNKSNTWRARISIDGKQVNIGFYRTPIEAAKEYDLAAKIYYGEFARTNFQ